MRISDWSSDVCSSDLVIPANITLLPLPAKCPELNPVENVWQFMRDNWLSNRIFKSYDDILDHCCFAWNRLTDQPWRIMSIGLRQWAHGSCSTSLGIRPYEVRFETRAGVQGQVDFARFVVDFTDEPGVARIVWLFSMVLGSSRLDRQRTRLN